MAQWVKYNGILLPPIKSEGLQFSYNKIWSANTGRNNAGEMVGTLIGVKRTLEISFNPLNYSQVNSLRNIINGTKVPFPKVEYQLNSGESGSFYAYSGDLSGDIYMDTPQKALYTNFKISIIEK